VGDATTVEELAELHLAFLLTEFASRLFLYHHLLKFTQLLDLSVPVLLFLTQLMHTGIIAKPNFHLFVPEVHFDIVALTLLV
jgi:hypothetical protein